MAIDTENVCLSGQTGSDRRMIEVTRLPHLGHRRFDWQATSI